MDLIKSVGEAAVAVKAGIDLLKSASGLLPKGKDRDEIEKKIKQADELLAGGNAKLAKDLGFQICKCIAPPNVSLMLWREKEKAYVCNNPDCGRTEKMPERPVVQVTPFSRARLARSRFGGD